MKKTFLEYVAEDLIRKHGTDLSRMAVVFPNKRASLFLGDALVRAAGRPVWSPTYITISDFFRKHSERTVADPIKLVCDLHKVFTACTRTPETLDHFYGWGQLLLADFDDIDKNMADAAKVFANLRDLHDFDDTSYLTPEQRAMLKRFFSTFQDSAADTELKRRFEQLWAHFYDIYTQFNAVLAMQQLAYEGALYREVACNTDIAWEHDKYVFVGFNVLQPVEQRLFQRLKDDGRACFYWDFDHYYMPKPGALPGMSNEAGHYIALYQQHFPNELDASQADIYDRFREPKRIAFVNASTENIQARYAGQWLREEGRLEAGRRTAIVMCDEGLLQPVLHNLPGGEERVNITTGYPLSQTPVASLCDLLYDLQTRGTRRGDDRFRMAMVEKVLRHPYASFISAEALPLLASLVEDHVFYPTRQLLSKDKALSLLFADLQTLAAESDRQLDEQTRANLQLIRWMASLMQTIGISTHDSEDALLQESVFRAYTLLTRLEQLLASGDLTVDGITLHRLLTQLIASTSIPLHGEPAVGLQVMGMLETRNLDFDHLLLLSTNEGNLPRGTDDSSFIPYAIRKAYGLTTIDHKVAIYSYYFHRLLQRCDDITIVYNGCTAGKGPTMEMSRFMLQMLVESPHQISRQVIETTDSTLSGQPESVAKDAGVMQRLHGYRKLSPTAINTYLRCQKRFYYQYVAGIKSPDTTDLTKDTRLFGLIFHRAAQLAYEPMSKAGREITADDMDRLLRKEVMEELVDQAFTDEVFKTKGRRATTADLNGIQLIYRRVILEYLRKLFLLDRRLTPFRVCGSEQKVGTTLDIDIPGHEAISIAIEGTIDRMDIVRREGRDLLRIVDYKTGKPAKTNNIESIEAIFLAENIDHHSDYFLQTMLYSLITAASPEWNPQRLNVAPALLYIKQSVGEDFDPLLSVGGEKVVDIDQHRQLFLACLSALIAAIYNPDDEFTPTTHTDRCATCAFAELCGV